MSEMFWEHVLIAALAIVPGTVAAASSLKNGRDIRRQNGKLFSIDKGSIEPEHWPYEAKSIRTKSDVKNSGKGESG